MKKLIPILLVLPLLIAQGCAKKEKAAIQIGKIEIMAARVRSHQ